MARAGATNPIPWRQAEGGGATSRNISAEQDGGRAVVGLASPSHEPPALRGQAQGETMAQCTSHGLLGASKHSATCALPHGCSLTRTRTMVGGRKKPMKQPCSNARGSIGSMGTVQRSGGWLGNNIHRNTCAVLRSFLGIAACGAHAAARARSTHLVPRMRTCRHVAVLERKRQRGPRKERTKACLCFRPRISCCRQESSARGSSTHPRPARRLALCCSVNSDASCMTPALPPLRENAPKGGAGLLGYPPANTPTQ